MLVYRHDSTQTLVEYQSEPYLLKKLHKNNTQKCVGM